MSVANHRHGLATAEETMSMIFPVSRPEIPRAVQRDQSVGASTLSVFSLISRTSYTAKFVTSVRFDLGPQHSE